MKVKFLKHTALNTRIHNKGTEADVSDDHGKLLISRGFAKPVAPSDEADAPAKPAKPPKG